MTFPLTEITVRWADCTANGKSKIYLTACMGGGSCIIDKKEQFRDFGTAQRVDKPVCTLAEVEKLGWILRKCINTNFF